MPFITEDSCVRLLQVLGHSLWQAAVVGVVVGSLLRLLSARRATMRYAVAVAGLIAIVVAIFVTWSVTGLRTTPDAAASVGVRHGYVGVQTVAAHDEKRLTQHPVPLQTATTSAESRTTRTSEQLPLSEVLVVVWLCGAGLMLVRGMRDVVTVRSWLRQSGQRADVSAIELLVREMSERLGLRRLVRVVVSDRVSVPAVCGVLWPVILVPTAMLSGIPAEQWRVIIAHELAHVRRWDAVVNLVQLVVESLLFFNPAVWWLSRQVRVEREACCDALAAVVTGQPLSVARTLVDVASALVDGVDRSQPRVALAFAEPTPEGELTDRVQRLVDPDRVPTPKASWLAFGAVAVVLVLLAFMLRRGSDLAVQVAAEWVSPKERIERLVALQEAQTGDEVPPATRAEGDEPKRSPETTPIKVHLVVRTDDGSPVGRRLNLNTIHVARNSSTSATESGPNADVAEFKTTLTKFPGKLRIAATLPGRAMAVSPILHLRAKDPEQTVELVLKVGATLPIVLRDPAGKAIAGTWLKANSVLTCANSRSGPNVLPDMQADDAGRVDVPNIGEAEVEIAIQAPGFQRHSLVERLDEAARSATAEQPYVVALQPALLTNVTIVDAESKSPIEAARLRALRIDSPGHSNFGSYSTLNASPDRWLDYALSDEFGIARLDQLRDGTSYSMQVLAEGYGSAVVKVRSGDAAQKVELRRPLTVKVRLTGSLERLSTMTGPQGSVRKLHVSRMLSELPFSAVLHDVDADGRFQIEGVAVGETLSFSLPHESKQVVVAADQPEVTFDIPPVSAESPKDDLREVEFRFLGLEEGAALRGRLYVTWWLEGRDRRAKAGTDWHAVANNAVRIQIPVGASVSISQSELIGYLGKAELQDVVAGKTPQIINVTLTPSGSMHGTVTRPDGTPADNAAVYALRSKSTDPAASQTTLNDGGIRSDSKFMRTLPLGATYLALAYERHAGAFLWAASPEFVLDHSQPIKELPMKLAPGRDLSLRLIDNARSPVVGQEVELEISFNANGSGFATSISSTSDRSGVVTFQKLSLDAPLGSVTLRLYSMVKPGRFKGLTQEVDPRKPVELRLQPGLTAAGVLINRDTQKPVPNTAMHILPDDFSKAAYRSRIETRTNERGEFRFEGLDAIKYHAYVPSATDVRTLTKDGVEKNAKRLELDGGGSDVRWEVKLGTQ